MTSLDAWVPLQIEDDEEIFAWPFFFGQALQQVDAGALNLTESHFPAIPCLARLPPLLRAVAGFDGGRVRAWRG